MTRYTSYDPKDERYVVHCFKSDGDNVQFYVKHYGGDDTPSVSGVVIDRLAEYENTDLTPADIDDLQQKLTEARKDVEILEKRLRHLLKSDTVAAFDAKDRNTGNYKLRIEDLDKMLRAKQPKKVKVRRVKHKEEKRLNYDNIQARITDDDIEFIQNGKVIVSLKKHAAEEAIG